MASETDFKEVTFKEDEEDEPRGLGGGVNEDHSTGDLGSPSKDKNHSSPHQQHLYHNNPYRRGNHFYGRHHSLTPPADDEEEGDDEDEDDTSEEIFGIPRGGNFPKPSATSTINMNQPTAMTRNLITNPFKNDSPVLEERPFAGSTHMNHNHSATSPTESASKLKSASYAIDPKGTGLSVRSSLSEPDSAVDNDSPEGNKPQPPAANVIPNPPAIIHTITHVAPPPLASHGLSRSPSMPERTNPAAFRSANPDHHHHNASNLTRGHSLSTSASTSSLATAATSHPLVQVIRDTVYSSFLYNKQKMQEKLYPLLPFPSSTSGTSGASGGSGSRTPFLLKSADPVLEARILALKNARYQIKQILHVTQGPLVSSLNSLSTSFSQLNLILNDLHSSRVDFSSSSLSSFPEAVLIPDGKSGRRGCTESEQQLRDLTGSLRALSAEAEKMKAGIDFFNANLDTLVKKTMADTLNTCSQLEVARIEFDAERNYLLSLQASGSSPTPPPTTTRRQIPTPSHGPDCREEKTRQRVIQLQQKYETLKSDVAIKMDFLYANREKVMNKSLSMFHSLMGNFFHPLPVTAGARTKLDAVLKAYSVKNPVSSPTSSSSSDVVSGSGKMK